MCPWGDTAGTEDIAHVSSGAKVIQRSGQNITSLTAAVKHNSYAFTLGLLHICSRCVNADSEEQRKCLLHKVTDLTLRHRGTEKTYSWFGVRKDTFLDLSLSHRQFLLDNILKEKGKKTLVQSDWACENIEVTQAVLCSYFFFFSSKPARMGNEFPGATDDRLSCSVGRDSG